MRRRMVMTCGAMLAVTMAGAFQLSAQTARSATPAARAWTPPRTADGQPDISGVWTNGTLTPFERPAGQTKAILTEEEAAALEKELTERRASGRGARRPGDVGSDNEAFVDTGYRITSTRQTSLVVDPPDGRVPFLPEILPKREFNVNNVDDYDTMSPWDRCITRGPTGIFPAGYNNGYEIYQARGYVVILTEMIHEARVIPLDGRPHADARIKSWSGDSRGRWEGNTLVVDTTNFHDRGWIATNAGSGRLRGTPHSDQLHLVERFTRIDPMTISYQMTVTDPKVYSRPWTFSIPLERDDVYRVYEYACHEGNQATALILRGARTLEKEAAAKK